MKIELPTLILAVVISTIIMVAFPDWARRTVQKWTPWGGDTSEPVTPVSGPQVGSNAWQSCNI